MRNQLSLFPPEQQDVLYQIQTQKGIIPELTNEQVRSFASLIETYPSKSLQDFNQYMDDISSLEKYVEEIAFEAKKGKSPTTTQ